MQLLCCQENRSLTIKLRKRKPEKKVEWTSDTVDNEHMGRRSSKCCCIYEKPRAFGESSTESDEEEEEGCGHTHCRIQDFQRSQLEDWSLRAHCLLRLLASETGCGVSASPDVPLSALPTPYWDLAIIFSASSMHSCRDESKTYHH
ncbi:E3 ubiquitin-protein ligase PPP1R11 isoform X3 [Meles meles]|uniref:E3 ubiquitin-protein ligase PPP1R11 isoform X3 n=1 Tax=Meles meles TaxID=9662 RepID=UPI001E69D0D5|nr:E3 ubiquitin-protein ligase PPP1R11 isoform X3 [Meles meles]